MQLNPKFLVTILVVFFVLIVGIFIGALTSLQKRVSNLEMRPIAIMPGEKIEVATPTATLIPTKPVIRASQSGVVK